MVSETRATLATGLFNAGTNVGVILTAIAVPLLTLYFGWRASFFVTGLLGFVMLIIWLRSYAAPSGHPRVSKEEMELISAGSDVEESAQRVSWTSLLKYRQTWALMLAKYVADPSWWFY